MCMSREINPLQYPAVPHNTELGQMRRGQVQQGHILEKRFCAGLHAAGLENVWRMETAFKVDMQGV